MNKQLNNMTSDLTTLYIQNGQLFRLIDQNKDKLDLENDSLVQELLNAHQTSEKALHDLLSDMPDIPVHTQVTDGSSKGMLNTFTHKLQDIETKGSSYLLGAILESEEVVIKKYGKALENEELPEAYETILREQLDQLVDLREKLNRAYKVG